MLSFFEYLRERVFQSILAGFQDALDVAEGKSATSVEQAAEKFRRTFGLNRAPLPPPSVPGSQGGKGETTSDVTKSSSFLAPPKRGPGRPRKDEPRS